MAPLTIFERCTVQQHYYINVLDFEYLLIFDKNKQELFIFHIQFSKAKNTFYTFTFVEKSILLFNLLRCFDGMFVRTVTVVCFRVTSEASFEIWLIFLHKAFPSFVLSQVLYVSDFFVKKVLFNDSCVDTDSVKRMFQDFLHSDDSKSNCINKHK
ncbi:hypothetical protein MAR_021315 [Mya arenaria]|uniref:Uncharacterized protein n=1 Tax=Mya arenaria TaxID=6604 RepID=A0ABY7EAK8_MYAAR|nr:hypothetical protein MAR_021315 [Mya arenaria]